MARRLLFSRSRRPNLEALEDRTVLSAAWPMYGLNPQHTGASTITGPQSKDLDWYASNVGGNGVAVGADALGRAVLYTNNVAAIDFEGALLWTYTIGSSNVVPALGADGTLYTGSENGLFYAINPTLPGAYIDETHQLVGGLKWSPLQLARSQTSPVIAPDGLTVYVSALDSYLYAVNTTNGTLKWRFKTGQEIESSPALTSDGSTIYVGSDDNALYAINASNGSLKWKFKAADDVNASPAVGPDGTVYFTTSNYKAYAVGADGKQKWRVNVGPNNAPLWADGGPAVDAGTSTVYFGGADGLYAYGYNGTLKWKAAAAQPVWSHPAIGADGTVYFQARDGVLRAVRSNGSALWSEVVGSSAHPALGAGGTLYAAGQGLYAFKDGGVGLPTIGWLQDSPDPVVAGGTLTLTAWEVADGGAGTIQKVDFYRDANGNGTLEVASDALVGTVANGGVVQLSLTAPTTAGTYTYFAVATDNPTPNHLSNVVKTTNTVTAALAPLGRLVGKKQAGVGLRAALADAALTPQQGSLYWGDVAGLLEALAATRRRAG